MWLGPRLIINTLRSNCFWITSWRGIQKLPAIYWWVFKVNVFIDEFFFLNMNENLCSVNNDVDIHQVLFKDVFSLPPAKNSTNPSFIAHTPSTVQSCHNKNTLMDVSTSLCQFVFDSLSLDHFSNVSSNKKIQEQRRLQGKKITNWSSAVDGVLRNLWEIQYWCFCLSQRHALVWHGVMVAS